MMEKLLKFQLRNIFHNKLFYVCLLITILTDPITSFIMPFAIKTNQAIPALQYIINYLSSEPGIVNIIFITLFFTFDFTEGTIKNIIARGYSKNIYLISKYIAVFIGLITVYAIVSIIYFILFISNGLGYETTMFPVLIYAFFKIITYSIFYGTIAFIFEKNSSAIIANLFLPNIVLLVLVNLDSIFKLSINDYWLESIGTNFLKNPSFNGLINPILMFIVYIVLFIFVGNYFAKNKEIK